MLAKKLKKTKKRSSFIASFLFVIASSALLFLTSCSEKAQEPLSKSPVAQKESKTSAEKGSDKKAKEQTSPDVRETYTYNPNGKVDPFVPTVAETTPDEVIKQKAGSKTPEQEIPMTPLQKLDVDDFKLVAVIATPTGFCALLEDPAMNGFKVKEGMQIGRKSGVIKRILYNSVIIEENSEIDNKNNEKKIVTLTLRKK
jgi:type IV pilus assembly protein PilP